MEASSSFPHPTRWRHRQRHPRISFSLLPVLAHCWFRENKKIERDEWKEASKNWIDKRNMLMDRWLHQGKEFHARSCCVPAGRRRQRRRRRCASFWNTKIQPTITICYILLMKVFPFLVLFLWFCPQSRRPTSIKKGQRKLSHDTKSTAKNVIPHNPICALTRMPETSQTIA